MVQYKLTILCGADASAAVSSGPRLFPQPLKLVICRVDRLPSTRLVMDRNQRTGLRRCSTVSCRDGLVAVGERCRNHHVELKFARCYQPCELHGSRDPSDLD